MDKIEEALTRGVQQVLPDKKALAELMAKRKIRLYQGFDPTGTKLHIGHAVGFRKLRQFQDLGHEVIFVIGDGTGQAGDPSGKKTPRDRFYSSEELRKNGKDYVMQAAKIVRFDGPNPVKIMYNGDWLNKLTLPEILEIAGHFSLSQMLERDLYQERLKSGTELSLREFLYPLLQGYDSVAMKVDLELGGSDQIFNMLAGRKLVKEYLNREKFVMTVPLLTDSTGAKIGKSEGNVIALTDAPNDFYGKIMTLPDDSIINCFTLLTDKPEEEINEIEKALEKGDNPIKFKKQLAFDLTKWLNSEKDALDAQKFFEQTFQERAPEFNIKVKAEENAAKTLIPFSPRQSMSSVKELIRQGAIDLNGEKLTDGSIKLKVGDKIKVGDRTFLKVEK
jgi:tyrosyl-tRNA synthetase